jgi:hypothetical protein
MQTEKKIKCFCQQETSLALVFLKVGLDFRVLKRNIFRRKSLDSTDLGEVAVQAAAARSYRAGSGLRRPTTRVQHRDPGGIRRAAEEGE